MKIYRHHKGNLYVIVDYVIIEKTMHRAVIYRRVNSLGEFLDCYKWMRPEEEFLETLPNGQQRFVLVSEVEPAQRKCFER